MSIPAGIRAGLHQNAAMIPIPVQPNTNTVTNPRGHTTSMNTCLTNSHHHPARPHPFSSALRLLILALALLLLPLPTTHSARLHLPNASFESPSTLFADPRIDAWAKSPKPVWYDEGGGFPWDQLAGAFLNTPPTAPDHITNLHGAQAAFFLAFPEVSLSQEANSSSNTTFTARYQIGKAYSLQAAVLGGGGGMSNGVTIDILLFYRDSAGTEKTAASLSITNSSTLFPSLNQFVDFQLDLPTVKPSDPWAGKNIGIRIASTVPMELRGGYWDIDNVRLTERIEIPNGSFESPSTLFADPRIDFWQKAPKPPAYDEAGGFPWDQLAGVFLNSTPDKPDSIVNMTGKQAAFLFGIPGVSLTLESGTPTSGGLNVLFEPNQSYQLTVAVLGGGMSNGATMDITLFYRASDGTAVPVGSRTITNTPTAFPTFTRFADYTLTLPPVRPSDPWAGKPIGIQLLPTALPPLHGGYWDVDDVRLASFPAPRLGVTRVGPPFELSLESDPGSRFELLSAPQPTGPWTPVATVTNATGRITLTDPQPASPTQRFFQARQIP